MCRVAYMLCSGLVLRFYLSSSRALLISPLLEQPGFSLALIQRSAWKGYSANFASTAFEEVRNT
jgi:hypothetical protein